MFCFIYSAYLCFCFVGLVTCIGCGIVGVGMVCVYICISSDSQLV